MLILITYSFVAQHFTAAQKVDLILAWPVAKDDRDEGGAGFSSSQILANMVVCGMGNMGGTVMRDDAILQGWSWGWTHSSGLPAVPARMWPSTLSCGDCPDVCYGTSQQWWYQGASPLASWSQSYKTSTDFHNMSKSTSSLLRELWSLFAFQLWNNSFSFHFLE